MDKAKTEIKFLLLLGTNGRSNKIYILFEGKNNFTTPTNTSATLASKLRYNVTLPSLNFLVFEIPISCKKYYSLYQNLHTKNLKYSQKTLLNNK